MQLCLKYSETYQAFLRLEKIGAKFDRSRALSGELRWIEKMRPYQKNAPPCPVLMDVAGGVFCDPSDGSFGCSIDVMHCFFIQAESDKWEPFAQSVRKEQSGHFSAEEDIARASEKLAEVDETTRTTLIEARRGQGKYRNDLIAVWGKCAVTRCAHIELLRASHIKPWRDASNLERLDKFNGLLLSPNLDAAFDRGLISFADNCSIVISPALSKETQASLGISPELKLVSVYEENRHYLALHRKRHGLGAQPLHPTPKG